jgi:hypothetical protein
MLLAQQWQGGYQLTHHHLFLPAPINVYNSPIAPRVIHMLATLRVFKWANVPRETLPFTRSPFFLICADNMWIICSSFTEGLQWQN